MLSVPWSGASSLQRVELLVAEDTQMEFFIKSIDPQILSLVVSCNDTIEKVKAKIYDVEGIPVHDQILIFAGTRLVDDRTLESNISNASTLWLVLRPGLPAIRSVITKLSC